MKLHRLLLALAAVSCLIGVAYLHHATQSVGNNQATETAGAKMVQAAEKFLDSLPAGQKSKATFARDDEERTRWNFVPLQDGNKKPTRKGIRLEEMSKESREAALALLKTATSAKGYATATAIMSLETILHELEKGGRTVRNPDWYFFTIFGAPSKTGKWGWRVEGHHLSLNFTLDGGKVVSATPAFFGANPATVKGGARKGEKTLTDADDLARELFQSLDDGQKKSAHQDKQFPETPAQTAAPKPGAARGMPAANMSDKQRTILMKLLVAYTSLMPDDIAAVEMNQVKEAGIDKLYFAFAGSAEEGNPHSYRIQGPTVVVEFLNVQGDGARNPANHIHSSWRSIKGDFGLATD